MHRILPVVVAVALHAGTAAAQDLVGHGGPVGALDLREGRVLSGAFDTRAILWSPDGRAEAVLRQHDGAVTAVLQLDDGWLVTGGQDGRVARWAPSAGMGAGSPPQMAEPRTAPVVALSVDAGGRLIAGYRDGWVQPVGDPGPVQGFQAHRDRLAGLAHLPDGSLVTVGADLTFRRWEGSRLVASAELPQLPNAIAVTDGRIAVVFADGALRLFDADGRLLPERFLSDRPLVAVAAGPGHIAAAAVDGTVWLLDAARVEPLHRLQPGQGPVWALALDGAELLTGGGDGRILRWSLATGMRLGRDDTLASDGAPDDGSHGARIWRACAACHTLTPDDGNRAGPTLYHIFGRRIGTAPNFDYSPALRQMEIVWTAETVSALFEFGPEAYTPGSRMPEQRLSDPADRAALIDYLSRHAH